MNKISRYLFASILIFVFQNAKAQNFGNEWINYNQTYYKFAVDTDRVYRLPISSLTALGMPNNVQGENLQVFRDGVEVPIFVSNSGALGANDYIEFYGTRADGKVELPLYKSANVQMNPKQNSISDTAFYFVTFNNLNTNKRFVFQQNNLVNPPLKETYFMDVTQAQYRNYFSGGISYIGKDVQPTALYQYSSQYDTSEGYCKTPSSLKDSVSVICKYPFNIVGGPSATFKTTVVGNSYIVSHKLKIHANSNEIKDVSFLDLQNVKISEAVPMSFISPQNKFSFRYTPYNSGQSFPDRIGIVSYELRYPRLFNFDNQSSFYFELDPKNQDYYIEITNFNNNNISPRLYDLSSQKYMIGDIATPGIVKFLIPASNAVKQLVLQSNGQASYANVYDLKTVQFKNYSLASNQGDYIMISQKAYADDGSGHNYLEDYKTYRNSLSGGSYNATVAFVDEIYNEFGYGYSFNPMAIKNFLHYAVKSPNWNFTPKHAFIIGKGISYNSYLTYAKTPYSTYPYYAIPGYGQPCSDNLFADFDLNNQPQLSIGRLPAMNGTEIGNYLQKAKDHDIQVNDFSHNISDSMLWRKRVLHLAGTKDAGEQASIVASLNSQSNIITKPYFGGDVTLLKKGTTQAVETANSETIDNLFNGGLAFIQFFGHSSSVTIDYNLDFPENYKNYKKYNVFMANGCSAGDMFILSGSKSLGERFVFEPNKASIAFIASDNTGYTNYLATYTDSLYYRFSKSMYGASLGEQIQNNVASLMSNPGLYNNGAFRTHCEQIGLNGDPAIYMYNSPKPDYAVEDKGITFKQINLTTSIDSLDIEVLAYNLGRYTNDSVDLIITRILPDNTTQVVVNKKYNGIADVDTVRFRIPTYGDLGLGMNTLDVTIDNAGLIDETTELNNHVSRTFNIYNDDLVPVFPYNFSIVNKQGITLKGSTLNAFAGTKKYVIQIDTTMHFDSPLLLSTNIESAGGVIKWQPNFTMRDSTVYYWRTAMDTLYGNHFHRWSNSSFVFINQGVEGWNQSHYYQVRDDAFNGVALDSASRLIEFDNLNKKMQVQTVCLHGPSPYSYYFPDYLVKINGSTLCNWGCPDPSNNIGNLQFIIIDSVTGLPWRNKKDLATNKGRFGSAAPCRYKTNGVDFDDPYFEFELRTTDQRNTARSFFDSIPNGVYVMMRNRLCVGSGCGVKNSRFINTWMDDTTVNGSGQSLYHTIKNFGFTMIDSFTKNRPMSFFMQKGFPNSIVQNMGIDSTVKLIVEYDFKSTLYNGNITSDKIGPAKLWNNFIKKAYSLDATPGDTVSVDIVGIEKNGVETVLATVLADTSISFIDANQYPYIRLNMNTSDNVHATAEQLKYWRVHYQPVPEAALNANRMFVFADTIGQGQTAKFKLAIENLTEIPMDSMLVKFDIIDKDRNKTTIATKRFKPLPILDTIQVDVDFNTNNFAGNNILLVEANPLNDQAEQFHPNNIGYKNFYVIADKQNPIIDVTFDGIHIFDGDIVSAKPNVLITLKDENKYLALDDTSLISVFIKYPGENASIEHLIPFDNNILKFTPATNIGDGSKNKATILYTPTYTTDGEDYILTVKAKDKSGNAAGTSGTQAYKTKFRVISKPSISSLLNYPNPFTTSTQFVFTLTGSQIPSNLKIQILAPTGKVVREITKAELGNVHIGRNITDFRWNGDDQYGQPLGNGVYLYRFVTNLNGNKMDHFNDGNDLVDKWIEKGYGKLYIMR